MRIVSGAEFRLDSRKSVQPFNGMICADVSEFESHMPSHAVGLFERCNVEFRIATDEVEVTRSRMSASPPQSGQFAHHHSKSA